MEQGNEREDAKRTTPRIYVASVADEKVGRRHGRWIDANQDVVTIGREVAAMLGTSKEPGADEWAIRDHEDFGPLVIGEHEDLKSVAEVGVFIAEHGPVAPALLQYLGGKGALEQARGVMADGEYLGEWPSLAAFVRDRYENYLGHILDEVPDELRNHIYYASLAREMKRNGTVYTVECGCSVHVFAG